jgi:hypothetical protein
MLANPWIDQHADRLVKGNEIAPITAEFTLSMTVNLCQESPESSCLTAYRFAEERQQLFNQSG